MIPTSYLFKDLYNDRWGDPLNPNAVDVPTPNQANDGEHLSNILARMGGFFTRHRRGRPTAWSFTIPSRTN